MRRPLSRAARAEIAAYGLRPVDYIAHWFPRDGAKMPSWGGDRCGCTDDRCAGFHHDEGEECGCLPALVRDVLAARGERKTLAAAWLFGERASA